MYCRNFVTIKAKYVQTDFCLVIMYTGGLDSIKAVPVRSMVMYMISMYGLYTHKRKVCMAETAIKDNENMMALRGGSLWCDKFNLVVFFTKE